MPTDPSFPTAEQLSQGADLTGKVVIVTGANTGIGKETARVLALRNAHVILAVRSADKGHEARKEILQSIGQDKASHLEVEELELGSQASIRAFADRFGKRKQQDLHILVNNAGVYNQERTVTQDGYESHFGVNHLGTYLLTILLLPYLKASAPSRIVVVASLAHTRATNPDIADYNLTKRPLENLAAYGTSKLYNILFANELARRLQGTGVTVNSLHPGLIATDLIRGTDEETKKAHTEGASETYNIPLLTIPQGAATSVFLATSEEGGSKSGQYYHGPQVQPTNDAAKNPDLAKELWDLSVKLTGVDA